MRWDNWFWNQLHRWRCRRFGGRQSLDNRGRDRSHNGRQIRLWEVTSEQELDLGLGLLRGLGDERVGRLGRQVRRQQDHGGQVKSPVRHRRKDNRELPCRPCRPDARGEVKMCVNDLRRQPSDSSW